MAGSSDELSVGGVEVEQAAARSRVLFSKAASISKRSVANMRKRWKVMAEARMNPTGEWWRDRQDAPTRDSDREPEETPEAIKADNINRANAVREALEGLIGWDHEGPRGRPV